MKDAIKNITIAILLIVLVACLSWMKEAFEHPLSIFSQERSRFLFQHGAPSGIKMFDWKLVEYKENSVRLSCFSFVHKQYGLSRFCEQMFTPPQRLETK